MTESGGEGRVIDITIARPDGCAGANEELAKYIGAVNFRLIGMRMMRRGVVVTWNAAFVVMLRIGANAKIAAPLQRPNRASVEHRQAA